MSDSEIFVRKKPKGIGDQQPAKPSEVRITLWVCGKCLPGLPVFVNIEHAAQIAEILHLTAEQLHQHIAGARQSGAPQVVGCFYHQDVAETILEQITALLPLVHLCHRFNLDPA